MNREILFRAKHIHTFPGNEHLNGTWVHGYLSDKKNLLVSLSVGQKTGQCITQCLHQILGMKLRICEKS